MDLVYGYFTDLILGDIWVCNVGGYGVKWMFIYRECIFYYYYLILLDWGIRWNRK